MATSLPLGSPLLLNPNIDYAVPSKASQISWQSVAGSSLLGSLDGTNFNSLGTSLAGEVKTVDSNSIFLKTAANDTTVVTKESGANGGSGNVFNDPISATGGINSPLLINGTSASIQFSGTTNAFPMIKRNLNTIDFRVADDSSYCSINAANHSVAAGGIFQFLTRGKIAAAADGVFFLANNGGTDFYRLCFGGITAAFPALKRNGTSLEVKLADDTGYAQLAALNTMVGGPGARSILGSAGDGVATLGNSLNTDFNRLCFGGTTSAFPALKRSGAGLLVRFADDSNYATVWAANLIAGGTNYISWAGATVSDPAIRKSTKFIQLRLGDNSGVSGDITASLPAAGAAQDGIIGFDTTINAFIYYVGGQRFKLAGVSF